MDALHALNDLPRGDTLFWRSLTWLVLALSALAILYFISEAATAAEAFWSEVVKPWWRDRRARRKQRAIAELEAEMDAERKRLGRIFPKEGTR